MIGALALLPSQNRSQVIPSAFRSAPQSWSCPPSSSPFSPNLLGSQTAILLCRAGLEAWAVQGPCLGAFSQGLSGGTGPLAFCLRCFQWLDGLVGLGRNMDLVWISLHVSCGPWWDHPGGSADRKKPVGARSLPRGRLQSTG